MGEVIISLRSTWRHGRESKFLYLLTTRAVITRSLVKHQSLSELGAVGRVSYKAVVITNTAGDESLRE
jgi:hypothetical protein